MRNIYIFIFFSIFNLVYAVGDRDEDRQLITTYLYTRELDKAKAIIYKNFIQSNSPTRQIIGYIELANCFSYEENEKKQVEAILNARKIANNSPNKLDYAYVNFGLAKYFRELGKYELFLKHFNDALKALTKIPNENVMLMRLYEEMVDYKLSTTFRANALEDYDKAIYYALKSENDFLSFSMYKNRACFNLRIYENKNEESYALKYKEDVKNAGDFINKITYGRAKNKAQLYHYLLQANLLTWSKKYKESNNLINKALSLDLSDKYLVSIASDLYLTQGCNYHLLGEFQNAEKSYFKSADLNKGPKTISSNQILALENLSILFNDIGKFDKAYHSQNQLLELIKKDSEIKLKDKTTALEIYYQTNEKIEKIKQLEIQNKIYSKQKLLYIGVILLSVIGIVFLISIIHYRQKINKQKTDLLQAEKYETELFLQLEKEEKMRLQVEQQLLTMHQKQLQKETLSVNARLDQKNTFIKELSEKIKDKEDPILERFFKEEKRTDADLFEIHTTIQRVHPNFYKKLVEISKLKLTNLDLKYAAYIYLNMDNQHISNILKVDLNTVRVTKYRLKRKLGLGKEEELSLFLQKIV